MKINLITNTYQKYHRQNVAVESWLHLKNLFPNDLTLQNLQFADEADTFTDHYDGVDTVFNLNTSSLTFEPKSIKKLPVLFEMIFNTFRKDEEIDYVVYTNSDVMVLPRLIEYILTEKPDCVACPRLDIQEIDSFQRVLEEKITPIRLEIAGYDIFVFSREFFNKYASYFNCSFVIGKPLFDVDFAGLMVILGEKYLIANSYPIMGLHIHHGTAAVTTDCPEKTHNERVHGDNVLFQVANNVMFHNLQYNLCRRQPWGAFLQPAADEQQVQSLFFNTINIHHGNSIRHI